MVDSASEIDLESDASSVDGLMNTKDQFAVNEQLQRRIESLQQENIVLKTEVDTLKLKIRGLQETNQQLRLNSVNIQVRAEQEEEYISNTLLKKITELKKEKESLALNYEQEEECLTNELNRKFTQLRQDKVALERTLAREQENQVSKLMRRIEKLETDMNAKQECLDRIRREKVELENALEQEQEALVNKLWKKMEKLEAEKRLLQEKLEAVGAPLSASSSNQSLSSLPASHSVPLSAGFGSLRGSLRHCHPTHHPAQPTINNANTIVAGQPIPPGRNSINSNIDVPTSHGVGVSNNDEGWLPRAAISANPSSVSIPPQSPMDIDIGDQPTSGAPSPSSNHINLSSAIVSHKSSRRTESAASTPHSTASAQNDAVETTSVGNAVVDSASASTYVNRLREEVTRLRRLLHRHEAERTSRLASIESEERSVAEENRRLRKMLQLEKERREVLSRQLSESESSLEMEDERQFNEASRSSRCRTTSDGCPPFNPSLPSPWSVPGSSTALYGPGHAFAAVVAAGQPTTRTCRECGHQLPQATAQAPLTIGASGRAFIHAAGIGPSAYIPSDYFFNSRASPGGATTPPQQTPTSIHAPTAPVTPTTSTGEPFLKPTRRAPILVTTTSSTVATRHSIPGDSVCLTPCSRTNESHRTSMEGDHSGRNSSLAGKNEQTAKEDEQNYDDDDDDEDARSVTPPSYHSDLPKQEPCLN